MLVPQKALNGYHPTKDIYSRGEEHKRCLLVLEEARAGAKTTLTAYGHPLMSVFSFKYLGRVLSALEDD